MLVPHQLSQGSFGRVLSVRDDQTNQVAQRPTEGKTKVITYTEDDVVVNITPSDPEQAAIFGAMQINLGQKTWDKVVPDVDPLWQAWLDAGLVTNELLADVPEANEAILARDKATKIAAIDAWLVTQDVAGIDVGGFHLKSDANAATQLSVYLSTLTPGVDTILVSDSQGVPHVVGWESLAELVATFKAEFNRRREAWATAKGAAMQAATTDELNAVAMPE